MPPQPPKLLQLVSQAIRTKHYSHRTEQTYLEWIKRYILFHHKRHPREMGAAEIEAFLRDPSPDDAAFAKVIDSFLQSERFGERWARHWLDVVRYADSVGRVWNAPFLYAARYRDWVIDSFNADKPYNRFVAEQIAGDLLPAPKGAEINRRGVIATGFLALGVGALLSFSLAFGVVPARVVCALPFVGNVIHVGP